MVSRVVSSAYEAGRTRAALVDRSDRGRVVATGADRRSYLHGLLTNDIAALTPGRGCYAAYLTAQGRMIADLHVYELGDAILLSMPGAVKDTVLARLDQFIFSEDVQLGDVTGSFAELAVIGPLAASAVGGALGVTRADVDRLPPNGCARLLFHGEPAIVTRLDDAGEAGFGVYVGRDQRADLTAALEARGAEPVSPDVAEAIRIEGGVPLFGPDMDEETIPLEAAIEDRAISLTKGCYVGQEVIVRILHRGHGRVARKLVGLRVEGSAPPAPGAPVVADGREVGRVTSSAWSPVLGAVALGYVLRDFIDAGTRVSVGGAPAVVTPRPMRASGQ
jgi:tRNA-modifying protein YgfZ